MRVDAQKNFKNALFFLRGTLIRLLSPELFNQAIAVSRFSIFLTEALRKPDAFSEVVIDGSCLRLSDPKAMRINLLRSVITRNLEMRFILFDETNLVPFHLEYPNLTVVQRTLRPETINGEFSALFSAFAATKISIVERLNAGLYALVSRHEFAHLDNERLLVDFAKSRVLKTKHSHCLIFENQISVRCLYFEIEAQVKMAVSSRRPSGGLWLHSKG